LLAWLPLYSESGSSTFLRNIGELLAGYTALNSYFVEMAVAAVFLFGGVGLNPH
jgi:hypothetical protein